MAREPRLGRARGRTGLFLLLGLGVFVVAVLQAGLLEPYLRQTATLRVLLPEQGIAGLQAGADVQLFGAPIGQVTDVVIRVDQPFYAETEIDAEMRPFIRADSRVVIGRQFGVAGAAFLEITRGRGEPLDWDFAVLEAGTGGGPTDDIGALIEEARERVFPLIEEATRAIALTADLLEQVQEPGGPVQQMLTRADTLTASIAEGEGTVGYLLEDDTLIRGLATTVELLNRQIAAMEPLLRNADAVTGNIAAGTEELPTLVATLEGTLASAQPLLRELAAATPAFAETARGAEAMTDELPEVLRRTSQTLAQMEDLLAALQNSWLIGGAGGGGEGGPSPLDVRP